MGIRADILKLIRTEVNGTTFTTATGVKTIKAVNSYFDPEEMLKHLPMVGVISEPENITLASMQGIRKSRRLRINIIGFHVVKSKGLVLGTGDSPNLFLEGEDFAESLIQKLTTQTAHDNFAATTSITTGCGFSIVDIGPVIVEQYEYGLDFIYVTTPCTVEFIDP